MSFSVGAGEVFGFLGPHGAGKTATIRTLLALLHPSSGSARSRRERVTLRFVLNPTPKEAP